MFGRTLRVDRPIKRWLERRAHPKLYGDVALTYSATSMHGTIREVPAVEQWTASDMDKIIKAIDRSDEVLCEECGDIVYDEEFIFPESDGTPLVLCSDQCRSDVLDNRRADEWED